MSLLLSILILMGTSSVDKAVIVLDPMSCGVTTNDRGERLDRLRRWAPGDPMCMYISIDNAYDYARKVTWKGNDGYPYGAGIDCRGNLTADKVPCLIDVTNRDFQVIRQVWVTCTTLRHCGYYGSDKGFCCQQ